MSKKAFVYPDAFEGADGALADGVWVYHLPSENSNLHLQEKHEWTVAGGFPVEVEVCLFYDPQLANVSQEWEPIGTYTDETKTLIKTGVFGFRFRATGGAGKIRLYSF